MNKKKLLVLPFIILNSVVIIAALFKGVQVSLGYYPLIGLKRLTLINYQYVLTNSFFKESLVYSCYLALTATLLSLFLGGLLAFLLLKVKSSVLHTIISLPISLPHIIVALMAMQLISQSGIISRLFYQLGIIQEIGEFPLLIHDVPGCGILLVFLYKEIPYVAVTVLAILLQLKMGYIEVAKSLGASSIRVFFTILLPMLQKTLITLFIILFCFTFASFEVPYLLGSPGHPTIALTIYDLLSQSDLITRPQAFALDIVMSIVCLIVTFIALTCSRFLPGGRKTF